MQQGPLVQRYGAQGAGRYAGKTGHLGCGSAPALAALVCTNQTLRLLTYRQTGSARGLSSTTRVYDMPRDHLHRAETLLLLPRSLHHPRQQHHWLRGQRSSCGPLVLVPSLEKGLQAQRQAALELSLVL